MLVADNFIYDLLFFIAKNGCDIKCYWFYDDSNVLERKKQHFLCKQNSFKINYVMCSAKRTFELSRLLI